ncbi:hypothetical protein ACSEV1_27320 [Pseudomonas aeruginosa]
MSQRSYMLGLAAGHFVRGVLQGMRETVDLAPQSRKPPPDFGERLRTAIAAGVQQFRHGTAVYAPSSAFARLTTRPAANGQSAGPLHHPAAARQLVTTPALVRKHGVDLQQWYLEHTHPVSEVPRSVQLDLFPAA